MYCYFKPRVTKLGQVPTQGLVWFFTISCCNTLHVTSINFTMHSKCLSMGTEQSLLTGLSGHLVVFMYKMASSLFTCCY